MAHDRAGLSGDRVRNVLLTDEDPSQFRGEREPASLAILRGAGIQSDLPGLHVDLPPLVEQSSAAAS